ncbi:sialidase family protein [Treponema sp. R80B11-R83G3]
MKNKSNVPLVHLIGIIALVAVIGFSMAACSGDDDNGGKKDDSGWKAVTDTTFGTSRINAIAWGGAAGQEKFVAVGGDSGIVNSGKIAYSSDGVTWTAVSNTTFTNAFNGITWGGTAGNEKFVAVGNGGAVATSPNGVTWTAVADSIFDIWFYAIVWGTDKFVAVGGNASIAYSSDGVTWTKLDRQVIGGVFGSSNNYIRDIAYSDDYWGPGTAKFVAVGDNGKMAYSSDGVTWTAVADSKLNFTIYAIAWGGNMTNAFVAGTPTGKIAFSSDGIIWINRLGDIEINSTFGEWGINAITYGNNKFVAVGWQGKAAYSSQVGDSQSAGWTWTAIANTTFNTSDNARGEIRGIAYGNGKFVAVGETQNDGGSLPHIAYWNDN